VKRPGRRHRRQLPDYRLSVRPRRSRQWYPEDTRLILKVVIGALVGVVLAYFMDKEADACEARGGKMVERAFTTRCEYPDVPAQPALDRVPPPSVLQTRDPEADSGPRLRASPPAGETP